MLDNRFFFCEQQKFHGKNCFQKTNKKIAENIAGIPSIQYFNQTAKCVTLKITEMQTNLSHTLKQQLKSI